MKRSQKYILSGLSLLACISIISVFYIGNQAYSTWFQKPLGPGLQRPTTWQLPATWTLTPATPRATITLASTFSFETPTPASPFMPCTNLPTTIILAIGNDTRSDQYRYGRADVIRAIRVDYRAKRITVLAFPRDLWVKIPEIIDDIGTSRQKLNTAYTYGNPGLGFWDHPSQGPGLLARTLDDNFGLQVDHYVAVSMNIFVDVVDALGGLDLTLPDGVDGRTSKDRSARLVFPPGKQHLSGEQALTMARIRNVSIFARADHQNQVVCAFQKKIKSPATIVKIPEIIASFKDNIQTDLSPSQLSQLACITTGIPRSNIVFVSFPREILTSDMVYDPVAKQDVFIWKSDFGDLRSYISRFEAGSWPAPAAAATTPEPGSSSCDIYE